MSNRTYNVRIWQGQEGYFIAQCIELPAAIAQGKTRAEAIEDIKEAIELVLEDIREEIIQKQTHAKVDHTEFIEIEA